MRSNLCVGLDLVSRSNFSLATELQSFYLEQNRVFKAGLNSAVKRRKTPCMLQHGIMEQDQVGSRAYFVLVFSREQIESNKFTQPVMIDRDCRGHWYLIVRGEILGLIKDQLQRRHLPRMFSFNQERKLGDRR